jgi:hypothetical protein
MTKPWPETLRARIDWCQGMEGGFTDREYARLYDIPIAIFEALDDEPNMLLPDDVLHKLAGKMGVYPDWLQHGRGPMIVPPEWTRRGQTP